MSVRELENHEGVYVPNFESTLQVYHITNTSHYPIPRSFELEKPIKGRLLGNPDNHPSEADRILAALKVIDKETYSRLGIKESAFKDFKFRLLAQEPSSDSMSNAVDSFLILSYTWHSNAWQAHPALAEPHPEIGGPLMPAMWAALLAQLKERECFWIDQLCIDQRSDTEKTAAIASMDLLYKSARKVIIALEDIALSTTEMDLMFMYATSKNSNVRFPEVDLDKISQAFAKIVSARWFDRAWCLHEFLVSRRHVFLVPVYRIDGQSGSMDPSILILRVDGVFLAEMWYCFIQKSLQHHFDEQQSPLKVNCFNGAKIDQIRRFGERLNALGFLEGLKSSETKVSEDGSFMHRFHEVFSHQAMYNSDKLSIVLNTMNSGLHLKEPMSLSEDDCLVMITMIALAAGDTTAMTTNGSKLIDDQHEIPQNKRWIRAPSSADQLRAVGYKPIQRTKINAKLVTEGLELDLFFLGTNLDLRSPSQHQLSIARWLIDHRGLSATQENEPALRLDIETDKHVYDTLRIAYIQTLACAFECGKEWMIAQYSKSYISLPGGVHVQLSSDAKDRFEKAVDWCLAAVIEHDIGADLNKTWQDYGSWFWVDDAPEEDNSMETEAQDPTLLENNSMDTEAQDSPPFLSSEEEVWFNIIINFTEQMIAFGLAVDQAISYGFKDTWNVQITRFSSAGSNCLVFVPAAQFHLCVPTALQDDSHGWMTRLWLLQMKESCFYSLLGKSRIVGDPSLRGQPKKMAIIVE